jgi:hypothetical protein
MGSQDVLRSSADPKGWDEVYEEYQSIRSDLETFWRHRPRNVSFYEAYPEDVWQLARRLEWLEDLLCLDEEDRFDHEQFDQEGLK